MFIGIKIAVIKSGRKSYEIANALGWKPSKLSMIINGSYVPTSCEKEDLAHELEVTVQELFNPHEQVSA